MAGTMDIQSKLRYEGTVTVPSKNNGPAEPLDYIPHQTVSPGKFTSLSATNVRIFKGPVKAIWRSTVQLSLNETSPGQTISFTKPCILYHISLKLVTKLYVLIRIIFIHGMLQPSNTSFPPTSFQNAVYTCPANSCLMKTPSCAFSADREKCCNTTSKEAGLVSLCVFPDHFFCTPCIVPSDSKLSRMRLIVTRVASFCCHFTPTESLDFAHIIEFPVSFQKCPALLERQALRRRFVLLIKPRTTLLVFMPLALSFQWKTYYIKYVTT